MRELIYERNYVMRRIVWQWYFPILEYEHSVILYINDA